MVTTKGRYALSIMLDLSQQPDNRYVSLSKIAERHNISLKYMESIVAMLNKAGMVESMRGKGGGYRLTRNPEDYSVASIIRLTERSIAPVACLENEINQCEHAFNCLTLPMWEKLEQLIDDYLESVTLKDLIENRISKNTA